MTQYFRTLPDLDPGSTQCPTLNVVLHQVLRVSEQKSKESVCNPVVLLQNLLLIVLFCLFYQSALCRQCAFVPYGLRVCHKTFKIKKLNKYTKKYIILQFI